MENGLCVNIVSPVSSSISYIGKSTTKQNSNASSLIRSKFSFFASQVRIKPAFFSVSFFLSSQIKNKVSPSLILVRAVISAFFSSPRNFAIGPANTPSFRVIYPNPPRATSSDIAYFSESSKNFFDLPLQSATIPRTGFPLNAGKATSAKNSVKSQIKSGFLKSGLSEPYVIMASA